MKERDYSLDLIRLIAIFFVVVIHVSNYYCRYQGDMGGVSFFAANIFNSVARVSVPLFFMISGALALGTDYPAKKLCSKVIHFLLVLIFWTLLYFVFDITYMGYTFSKKDLLLAVFEPLKPHLWFMYAIIALYLVIPFARILVKHLSDSGKKYFVILWLSFVGVVQIYRETLKLAGIETELKYEVPLIQGAYYFGYFVVGYLLYEAIQKGWTLKKSIAVAILCASLIIVTAVTYVSSICRGKYFGSYQNYSNLFVMLASLAVFVLMVMEMRDKVLGDGIKRVLGTLSPLLFGVYLIHIIFFDLLIRSVDIKPFNGVWAVPVFSLGIFVVSLLCAFWLNRVPFIKNVIK